MLREQSGRESDRKTLSPDKGEKSPFAAPFVITFDFPGSQHHRQGHFWGLDPPFRAQQAAVPSFVSCSSSLLHVCASSRSSGLDTRLLIRSLLPNYLTFQLQHSGTPIPKTGVNFLWTHTWEGLEVCSCSEGEETDGYWAGGAAGFRTLRFCSL
jgi:hypothetical protein